MTIRLDEVPATGLGTSRSRQTPRVRAVAKAAKVDAVEALSATFDLNAARATACAVGRACARPPPARSSPLEPVVTTVEETIDAAPPLREAEVGVRRAWSLTTVWFCRAREPPEPLVDGAVDSGAHATEFLILGIDPYPRTGRPRLGTAAATAGGARPSLAALAALKKTSKVKD